MTRFEEAKIRELKKSPSSLLSLFLSAILLSGCAGKFSSPTDLQPTSAVTDFEVPSEPDNSDHGYLTEDDRIPTLNSCPEWTQFWVGGGPAVSFEVANRYLGTYQVEVSTQIYLKNRHLDSNSDGILCNENLPPNESPTLATANFPENAQPLDKCMLRGTGQGSGFPRPKGYLPAKTDIHAVMLFVEFPNIKITEDIQVEARSYYEKFQWFMNIQSLGQQTWNFSVPDEVFRISRDPREYGADFTKANFGSPNFMLYLQDAVSAADHAVDFSKFDVVYVIPPKEIGTVISYGPSSPKLPSGAIVSDEGSIKAAATAGNDSRLGFNSEPWVWLAHETGHLYGLAHPLNEKGRFDKFGRELSAENRTELWDLMSWMRSPSPNLWGWSRFWVGWLGEEETYCINPKRLKYGIDLNLAFAESHSRPGEVQLAILPLSATRALVFESRKPSEGPFNGEGRLLVYKVDVTKGDNEGQIQIVKANDERFEGYLDGSMRSGEILTFDEIKIEITGQTSNGVSVSIKRP